MPPPPTEVFASRFFLGPALRTQPDRRLVTLVREGYETAFEEIVRRHGRPLTRYAAAIVGSRSEDVTQDAFSKALLAMRHNDGAEIELRPWLYRIVRNTALNDLRDRPPTPEILEETIAAGRSVAAEAEQREELRELIERLHALPERQRAAIVMRELEGLSHEEIAAALGLSGGAARQAIFRARQALRDGVGVLLPLPILRLLLEQGPEATAGAGAGAAGVLAAGGAAGGAGAGTALKAGAVAAILAGSVGTGIALQGNHGNGGRANAATVQTEKTSGHGFQAPADLPPPSDDATPGSEPGDDHDGDRNLGPGSSGGDADDDRHGGGDVARELAPDDHSGPGHSGRHGIEAGRGGEDDSRGSGPGTVGGNSGPGGGDDRDGAEDRHGGRSGGSGHSGGSGEATEPGGGEGGDDRSGSGGGGDDRSGPGGGTEVRGGDGGGPVPSESEPVEEPDGDGGDGDSSGPGPGTELEPGSGSGSSVSGGSDEPTP